LPESFAHLYGADCKSGGLCGERIRQEKFVEEKELPLLVWGSIKFHRNGDAHTINKFLRVSVMQFFKEFLRFTNNMQNKLFP